MIRCAGLVALVTMFAACSPSDSKTSSESPTHSSSTPSSSVPVPTPVVNCPDSAEGLAGNWKLVMGSMTWTVCLAPRDRLPGEYLGTAQRETRDEAGRLVTMDIGAVREKDVFRAWLGPGVIKCKGPFHPDKDIQGDCTEIDGDPAGKFHAQRLSASATPGLAPDK
jgi:hypothetical protein